MICTTNSVCEILTEPEKMYMSLTFATLPLCRAVVAGVASGAGEEQDAGEDLTPLRSRHPRLLGHQPNNRPGAPPSQNMIL